jgi:hypothetical protein
MSERLRELIEKRAETKRIVLKLNSKVRMSAP